MQIDLVRTYDKALFNEFLCDLQNIFPSIEDIKMDLVAGSEFYNLYMLENGKWIPKNSIAGGILKTVYLLAVINFNFQNFCLYSIWLKKLQAALFFLRFLLFLKLKLLSSFIEKYFVYSLFLPLNIEGIVLFF